jgi:hypothetical protein
MEQQPGSPLSVLYTLRHRAVTEAGGRRHRAWTGDLNGQCTNTVHGLVTVWPSTHDCGTASIRRPCFSISGEGRWEEAVNCPCSSHRILLWLSESNDQQSSKVQTSNLLDCAKSLSNRQLVSSQINFLAFLLCVMTSRSYIKQQSAG